MVPSAGTSTYVVHGSCRLTIACTVRPLTDSVIVWRRRVPASTTSRGRVLGVSMGVMDVVDGVDDAVVVGWVCGSGAAVPGTDRFPPRRTTAAPPVSTTAALATRPARGSRR